MLYKLSSVINLDLFWKQVFSYNGFSPKILNQTFNLDLITFQLNINQYGILPLPIRMNTFLGFQPLNEAVSPTRWQYQSQV